MNKLCRLLLVCLLSLSIPLQGLATLAMASPATMQPMQEGMQMTMPCHGSMLHDVGIQEHGHAMDLHLPFAKAKVCNCCCTAMMDAQAVPVLAAEIEQDRYLAPVFPDPVGYIPDGLERPPRSTS